MNDTRYRTLCARASHRKHFCVPGHHACAIRHSEDDEERQENVSKHCHRFPQSESGLGNTLISPLQPKGSLVDPAKGYRLQDSEAVYNMITDNQIIDCSRLRSRVV